MRVRLLSSTRWIFALTASMLALSACNEGIFASHPRAQVLTQGSPTEAARIDVEAVDKHPALVVVHRDGDPFGGFAALVRTGPDATPPKAALKERASLGLSMLVEKRLRAAGLSPRRRNSNESFTIGLALEGESVGPVFSVFHDALATPVTESEAEDIGKEIERKPPSTEKNVFEAIDACEGLPSAEGSRPSRATLEAARVHAFGRERVTFAVVGSAHLGDSALAALKEAAEFPAGDAPTPESLPTSDEFNAAILTGKKGLTIRAAMSVSDPRTAIWMSEELANPTRGDGDGARLVQKLARLHVPFTIDRVVGVSHASGGCVSVRMNANIEDGFAHAASEATNVLQGEWLALAKEAAPTDLAVKKVLQATDPIESAELAVWWSKAVPAAGKAPVFFAGVALPEGTDESEAVKVRDSLRSLPADSAPPAIDTVGRVESGQGELWVALGNPCALDEETPRQWGALALAVTSRAFTADGSRGVRVEPWVSARGVGVIAHSDRLKDESAEEQARRVGERAAFALLGGAPTVEALAQAGAHDRALIERAWGRESFGLSKFADALAPLHPSWVEPLGSYADITRMETDQVEGALSTLQDGPLRLAVLANDSAVQTRAASDAVLKWSTASRGGVCPKRADSPPRSGHDDLKPESSTRTAAFTSGRTLIAVPFAEADRDSAEVLVELFRGTDSIASPLSASQATIIARVVGSPPAVVLTVDAPDEHIDEATKALTELLSSVAHSSVSEPAMKAALSRAGEDERQRLADPRARLEEMFVRRSDFTLPAAPNPAHFNAWASNALKPERFVVLETHR